MLRRDETPMDVDVLVVGGGPVGLIQTLLLEQLGVKVAVVEQRHEAQTAPAAHVISARTFEILRSLGLDMDAVDALCQRPSDGGWVRWVESLSGDEIGRVPFESLHLGSEPLRTSPHPLRNLSQHRLEPFLRTHVSDLRSGLRWTTARYEGDVVVSTLENVTSGEGVEIRSRYVIAADGAGSAVRRFLGVTMVGPEEIQNFVAIHVETDLREVVRDRPGTLYWITDPEHAGTFIAHDPATTWVYMRNFDPRTESLADYSPERAEFLFRQASKMPDDLALSVRHVTTWRMSFQVAETYRVGSFFLVGDAAHRFPPTGGLGLNTGAPDAQNLAWKLKLVLDGVAPDALLDTYERERHPVAERNGQTSLDNAFRLMDVWVALGVSDDIEESRRTMAKVLATPEGRDNVRRAIEGQEEHFDQLGVQLGTSYTAEGGVVVTDGTTPPAPANAVREYIPSTGPGARLPHVWLQSPNGPVSTLDLVTPGKFLLLTNSPEWRDLASDPTWPLTRVCVGSDVTDDSGAWAAVSGIGDRGALVVRPDQHVAWRTTESPTSALPLADVMRALLQHSR